LRAGVADLHGKLGRRHWEESAARFCTHVWFTDCSSTNESLKRPVPKKGLDKRIGMELAALRQCLWRRKDGGKTDPRMYDAMPCIPTDICHWVDSAVMIGDPLTKAMKADLLKKVLKENCWSWKQTEEMKADKARRQGHRQTARAKKNALKDATSAERDDHDPWRAERGDHGPWHTARGDHDPWHTEGSGSDPAREHAAGAATSSRDAGYGKLSCETHRARMAQKLSPLRTKGAMGKEPGILM